MTTIPKATAGSGVYAAALVAIGAHIDRYQLAAPRDITRHDHPSGVSIPELRLDAEQHEPWLETIEVDDTVVRRHTGMPAYQVVTWTARLCDTGTRVLVTCSQRLELRAVPCEVPSGMSA